jgi:hypothetical protein
VGMMIGAANDGKGGTRSVQGGDSHPFDSSGEGPDRCSTPDNRQRPEEVR